MGATVSSVVVYSAVSEWRLGGGVRSVVVPPAEITRLARVASLLLESDCGIVIFCRLSYRNPTPRAPLGARAT